MHTDILAASLNHKMVVNEVVRPLPKRLLKLKNVLEIVPTCLVDVLVCSRVLLSEGR